VLVVFCDALAEGTERSGARPRSGITRRSLSTKAAARCLHRSCVPSRDFQGWFLVAYVVWQHTPDPYVGEATRLPCIQP
jgi:hypothetical protein